MQYLLVGASKQLYMGTSCSGHNMYFNYESKQMEKVFLHLLQLNSYDKYEVVLWGSEGECGIGWTTASWGHSSLNKVNSFTNPPTYNCQPILVDVAQTEDNIEVETLDNVRVASASYWGADKYYPNGWYTFNESIFTVSPRAVDKMKVFVFKGPSAIGKSYLASKFVDEFKVYETDCSSELPSDMNDYDVVVLGNKYEFPELVELLEATRDVVMVNFC
jgi:hypothetical protein